MKTLALGLVGLCLTITTAGSEALQRDQARPSKNAGNTALANKPQQEELKPNAPKRGPQLNKPKNEESQPSAPKPGQQPDKPRNEESQPNAPKPVQQPKLGPEKGITESIAQNIKERVPFPGNLSLTPIPLYVQNIQRIPSCEQDVLSLPSAVVPKTGVMEVLENCGLTSPLQQQMLQRGHRNREDNVPPRQ